MKKVLGGIFSFVPLVTFVVFVGLFVDFYSTCDMDAVLTDAQMVYMIFIFIGIVVSVVSTFAVMIWELYLVKRNLNFTERQKIVWYVLLYCANMFVYPAYWYLYVHKRVDEKYPFYPERNKLWW